MIRPSVNRVGANFMIVQICPLLSYMYLPTTLALVITLSHTNKDGQNYNLLRHHEQSLDHGIQALASWLHRRGCSLASADAVARLASVIVPV